MQTNTPINDMKQQNHVKVVYSFFNQNLVRRTVKGTFSARMTPYTLRSSNLELIAVIAAVNPAKMNLRTIVFLSNAEVGHHAQ